MFPCVRPGSINKGSGGWSLAGVMLKGNQTRIVHELIISFLKAVTISDDFSVFCLFVVSTLYSAGHLKNTVNYSICVMNEKIHNAVPSFSSYSECTLSCPLTQSIRTISDLVNSFPQKKSTYLGQCSLTLPWR